MRDLSSIIKAYDVRGVVPDQWDSDLARDIGAAFVQVIKAGHEDGGPGAVVVGHDMRPTGPDLVAAFCDGVNGQGCDVIDIGMCSTDGLYFASGRLGLPGAMFTASHNPAEYNGIKLCGPGATPVGEDSGLALIRDMVSQGPVPDRVVEPGTVRHRDMLADYATFLRSLVDISGIRPLKVVVDAGNGMGGYTVPAVLGTAAGLPELPITVIPLYFDLDGTFPNHEANPIEPENLVDLQAKVRQLDADLGLAFDGDADRCFVVDDRGAIVSPSVITSLIAEQVLAREPGATIIHNLITSRAVPELVTDAGGVPERTRVGHSFIKERMAATGAAFGGEHSGHFYFRDFWRADSGMLAALNVLAVLGSTPEGTTLSGLLDAYERYVSTGEINTTVSDVEAALDRVRRTFGDRGDVDDLDGVTVSTPDWWFNVRPSNTEPLLRLNAEAADPETLAALRDEVIAVIEEAS